MRTLKLILIVAAIFSLIRACDLLKWSRYHNREYGFSILLPRFWAIQEKYKDAMVAAFDYPSGPSDKFQENMNVRIKELPNEIPLDAFFEINKEWLLESGIRGIKSEISEGTVFAGKDKGKWLIFNNRTDKLSLKIIISIWLKGKRAYIVNCVAENTKFPKYELIFKTSLRSFRIK